MDEDIEKFAISVAALKRLTECHQRFASYIASVEKQSFNGGSFTSDGRNLAASVLGIELQVVCQPISDGSYFVACEYSFIAEYKGEHLYIWHLYLDSSGGLFTDSGLCDRYADFDNPYLCSRIVASLGAALMTSPIFAREI